MLKRIIVFAMNEEWDNGVSLVFVNDAVGSFKLWLCEKFSDASRVLILNGIG